MLESNNYIFNILSNRSHLVYFQSSKKLLFSHSGHFAQFECDFFFPSMSKISADTQETMMALHITEWCKPGTVSEKINFGKVQAPPVPQKTDVGKKK
jgi:hypothetical protein